MKEIGFMEVGKFKIGHAQDVEGATGCTVFLPDECAVAGVDIRGGGPASREAHLLDSQMAATGIHAILLSGGSAFGLDAAGGVMQFLEERNIGFDVGVTKVPLVCQSSLFDLMVGDMKARPNKEMAYEACQNASYNENEQGNIGAGTGCTVGKVLGPKYAMKCGLGTYATQLGDIKVGALVAVNALGDIYNPETGKQVAGLLTPNKTSLRSSESVLYEQTQPNLFTGNTTLGIVVTNCKFSKSEMNKIASMAHNGYARAISPVHTTADGDSIYAVSTGEVESDVNVIGTLASRVIEKAILSAVLHTKSAYGFKGDYPL
ncbi:MAG: peptidase [Epulopiscium sp. Nele67-Bin005]|nr:MAG: peptidase [Epulopiscium sp. Nele67-Bin005]